MKALLFSGGIDSSALAYGLRPERMLFIDYGQRPAEGERAAARRVASLIGAELDEFAMDMSPLGRGSMAWGAPVPGRPPEHWPYRNQMLLTMAAMYYSDKPLDSVMVGTVQGDDEHSDGSAAFIAAVDRVMIVQSGLRVEAPGLTRTSEQLILDYQVPAEILTATFSCHESVSGCGQCRGCRKRARVLESVGDRIGIAASR